MTLFEELKKTTKPAHDELEAALDLLSPDVTIADYRRIIEKFWGVYVPVENAIRNSEIEEFYEGRWKSDLLKKDLISLGHTEQEIEELPLCDSFSSIDNTGDLLGTLYVLEGSSLGALILTKHFHSRFHLTNLNGLAYFSGYGDKTLIKWKEWREKSEKLAREKNLSSSAIVSQANKTFTTLKMWMPSR